MKICSKENCNRTDVRSSGLCKKHHHAKWVMEKTGKIIKEREKKYTFCQAPNCKNHTSKQRNKYCEMHYGRLRRSGTFDCISIPDGDTKYHSSGYIMEYRNNHEKFGKGRHYQHRLVFYDNHGEGPFNCFDCGKQVGWDDMHVHHMNEIKDDNTPSNLVASCASCNHDFSRSYAIKRQHEVSKWNIEYNGEKKYIGEWAKEVGIAVHNLKWRLNNEWSIEDALTKHTRATGPRR